MSLPCSTYLFAKLRSHDAAKRRVLPHVIHRQSRYLNNRAENSHQPTRQRERRMKRFKTPQYAQRFLSVLDPVATHFRTHRHRISAARNRAMIKIRIATWTKWPACTAKLGPDH